MRYSQDGQAITRLSLATDRPGKPGEPSEPDWHSVVCFGKLAEFVNQYVTKGRLVFAAGRLTYRSWESKDGQRRRTAEVVASEVVPLDRRPETEAAATATEAEDDVPF
jgi:single-strand DNA-binding protein